MKIFTRDGKPIPFDSIESRSNLTLGPAPFRGADRGKTLLDETLRELYDKPNIRTADLYLLQQPTHLPRETITPEFARELLAGGAVADRTLGGVILLPEGLPQILTEYHSDGWIHLKQITRHYQVGDGVFAHTPRGPRVPQRTPTSDPRAVTDREQAIIDSSPEYMKVEISITEKTNRRFDREALTEEMSKAPRMSVGTFNNHGIATFGDSSPVIISARELAKHLIPLVDDLPSDSISQNDRGQLRDCLTQFSVGVASELAAEAISSVLRFAPLLGPLAYALLSLLGHQPRI